ncbi:hypothetical protein FA13DRAFT_685804 [Coprinellus micaceus]|uniref:Uncharacterized protein n=1 Tax=Coprinellus micaceus TaxID=71717 RepID=A0A4Y7T509_COPMI|nr:hypothetical protein FA13DRAFT_685804 [Coprinellus micaceus]
MPPAPWHTRDYFVSPPRDLPPVDLLAMHSGYRDSDGLDKLNGQITAPGHRLKPSKGEARPPDRLPVAVPDLLLQPANFSAQILVWVLWILPSLFLTLRMKLVSFRNVHLETSTPHLFATIKDDFALAALTRMGGTDRWGALRV